MGKEKIQECIDSFGISFGFDVYFDREKFVEILNNIIYEQGVEPSKLIESEEYLNFILDFSRNQKEIQDEFFFESVKKSIIITLKTRILRCISEPSKNLKVLKEKITPSFSVDVTDNIYSKVSRIYENFYESLSEEAQKSLCLYYTYYLLRLKSNYDFDYEFKVLENRLYDDFYYYGLYSIARELRHVVDNFNVFIEVEEEEKEETEMFFKSHKLSRYITSPNRDGEFHVEKELDEIAQRISDCVDVNKENIYDIIKIYLIRHFTDFEENPKHFLYLLETNFNYISKPEDILNYAISLFEIEEKEKDDCRWERGYGGEMWASIAKTMRDRNEYTKTTFVDTCWSLQHNNALWFDKIAESDTIQYLKQLLDDIEDGDFSNIYQCALNYEGKLRRAIYRESLGIKYGSEYELLAPSWEL